MALPRSSPPARRRANASRPGRVYAGKPAATLWSSTARALAVLARRLRGRQARLGARVTALTTFSSSLEEWAASLDDKADALAAAFDRVWAPLVDTGPELFSEPEANERFLRRSALFFEFTGGLVIAQGLGLEVRFGWSWAALLETVTALGVAGAVGFAFYLAGETLGRTRAKIRDAAWAADCVDKDSLSKFPGLVSTRADRKTTRAAWFFLFLLLVAAIAVRGTPTLLKPAAASNPLIVMLAFVGGSLALATAAIGYFLGSRRGPTGQAYLNAKSEVTKARARVDRVGLVAKVLRASADSANYRLRSEQEAMRAESAAIMADGGGEALDTAEETPEAVGAVTATMTRLHLDQVAFPGPRLEAAAIPDPGSCQTQRWTPRVVSGGRKR